MKNFILTLCTLSFICAQTVRASDFESYESYESDPCDAVAKLTEQTNKAQIENADAQVVLENLEFKLRQKEVLVYVNGAAEVIGVIVLGFALNETQPFSSRYVSKLTKVLYGLGTVSAVANGILITVHATKLPALYRAVQNAKNETIRKNAILSAQKTKLEAALAQCQGINITQK